MLQKNPLQPPRPFASRESAPTTPAGRSCAAFVSADDFDGTGILTGVDPCESRYWWMPELYGPDQAGGAQATSRVLTRSTAAS